MKTQLGHYEIVSELGRGGMGVVYKGFDPALNRFVAIKELSPSLAHDANLVERFLREARSMAVLQDPYIIQVYFIGTDEATGQPFFAMEFIEGESLSGLLKREGQLSVENALKLMNQTAQGLATAHDKGVVHRDIKPANLMITPKGMVKIADFGIALASQDFSKKLTATGEFVGTPGYLSPEVCLGKPVDQRSDIFALGIVLYEMLSGRIPFTDESPLGLMLEVVKAEIPDIRTINNAVDPQCAEILAKMLAKEPTDRFQNCHELAAALQAHPLVAKGGTVQLSKPKIEATPAATVVGSPTPASLQQRAPTPPPVVRSATPAPAAVAPPQPPAAAYEAPPARASALDRPPRNASRASLLVLAAGLLLAAGLTFAFRGVIGEFLLRSDEPATTAVAPSSASSSAAAQPAASPAPASAAPANPVAAAPTDPASNAVSTPSPALEPSTAPPPSTLASAAPAAVEASPAAAAPTPAPALAEAPARPRERLAAALRRDDRALAKAEPPRDPSVPPPPPRVAVVTVGDPALTQAARQRIEERLWAEGFEVLDANLVSGLDGGGDLGRLFGGLRRDAAAVILVRAEPLGQQQLNFYGQSSTLYSANLSVRAYSVADKRALGPGFRERVDFTTLNVDANTGIALQAHLAGVLRELSPFRSRAAG